MSGFLALLLSVSGAAAQEHPEFMFAQKFFDLLQPKSIAHNREYCGYFGFDPDDRIVATTPTRGQEDSCLAADPPPDLALFASYHTHGSFSAQVDSELPSTSDMRADNMEELDGYVATPGGRIWFIDGAEEQATMLCGPGCTVSDPAYSQDGFPPVKSRYTIGQLFHRYAQNH